MGMPVDLVLVRHGESEGNVAVGRSKKGDHSLYTEEFKSRHSSLWRLTDRGREQARIAGAWIRDNVGASFDRYYASSFLRAMETAALLELPHAQWYAEFYLRERERGNLDVVADDELKARYADDLRRRGINAFYWTPSGGESMADLCLRLERVIDTLHRHGEGKRVIIVCHGEVMWAFRMRLERMSAKRFLELDASRDPKNMMHNCQIVHYTRRDPESGKVASYVKWMRSVCPTDLTRSRNVWEPVERPLYSNEELLAYAETVPRLISG